SGVNAYLRQKAAARRRRLVFGQACGKLHLTSLRSLAEGVPLIVPKQAVRKGQRRQRRGQGVRSVEWQAERIVERGAGYVEVGGAPDLLLANTGEVNANREHVGIGGHPRRPDRLGALKAGFGRAHGLAGRMELLRAEQR